MPIKKDGTGKRWVEMEILVPGTPEQVWQAIATGPGYAAWFTKSEIEPRVGGALRFDFGQGAISAGEVTEWEPPHRFSYVEREWDEGAPPVATEITITGRAGDRCVMRMVHSLFTTSDDWDDQVEGFESGWPAFFDVLRIYLSHFAGAPGASCGGMSRASGDSLSVWRRLCGALGLTGASVGERRTAESAPEPWSGIVEQVHQTPQQRYVLLRIDSPNPGVALVSTYDKGATSHSAAGQGTNVSVSRYFYGENADQLAAESEPRWLEWLSRTFAAPNTK